MKHSHEQATMTQLRDDIEHYLNSGEKIKLLRLIHKERPANIAQVFDMLNMEPVAEAFKTLLLEDVNACAEVLIELEPSTLIQLYSSLSIQEWAWICSELDDDDVVSILEIFPEEAHDQLVAHLAKDDKADVMELMTYPEDSAGRIMTNEFLALDGDQTVAATVEMIRSSRHMDPTNLFYVYVISNDRLVGTVSLRQLLLGKKADKLSTIMHLDVVTVPANMDQEQVAYLFRKHNVVNVPVIDAFDQVLGIITVDDVIDVINEESEEDLYQFIGSSDEELLAGDDVPKIVWIRLPWIFASFLGSLLVATLMKMAEQDWFSDAAKVFVFVPLVCAMGGNVGVQSATIMARFLSTNQPDWSEARRTTFKEARVGLMLGALCGVGVGMFAWSLDGRAMMVTVTVAMICAMTTAATTGTILPVVMKRLGFDPALATGPFVTSFNDVLATCVYFSIAFVMLDHS